MKIYATVSNGKEKVRSEAEGTLEVVLERGDEQVGIVELQDGWLYVEVDGLGVIFDGELPKL